jgi:hypothetical protein
MIDKPEDKLNNEIKEILGENHISVFSSGHKHASPIDVIKIAKVIEKLSCTVYKTNGWKDLPIGTKFTLTLDKKTIRGMKFPQQFWNQSTEHLVFYADLLIDEKPIKKVIIKFHLYSSSQDSSKVSVIHMTQSHAEGIIANYNDFKGFLEKGQKDSKFQNISLVNVCIAKSEKRSWLGLWNNEYNNLWIEEYLVGYKRLWNDLSWYSPTIHNHILSSTDIPELQELQYYIYRETLGKRTICDLQGCYNRENGTFVLCDIEFTDTLQKFDISNDELLDDYCYHLPFHRKLITTLIKAGTIPSPAVSSLGTGSSSSESSNSHSFAAVAIPSPHQHSIYSNGLSEWQFSVFLANCWYHGFIETAAPSLAMICIHSIALPMILYQKYYEKLKEMKEKKYESLSASDEPFSYVLTPSKPLKADEVTNKASFSFTEFLSFFSLFMKSLSYFTKMTLISLCFLFFFAPITILYYHCIFSFLTIIEFMIVFKKNEKAKTFQRTSFRLNVTYNVINEEAMKDATNQLNGDLPSGIILSFSDIVWFQLIEWICETTLMKKVIWFPSIFQSNDSTSSCSSCLSPILPLSYHSLLLFFYLFSISLSYIFSIHNNGNSTYSNSNKRNLQNQQQVNPYISLLFPLSFFFWEILKFIFQWKIHFSLFYMLPVTLFGYYLAVRYDVIESSLSLIRWIVTLRCTWCLLEGAFSTSDSWIITGFILGHMLAFPCYGLTCYHLYLKEKMPQDKIWYKKCYTKAIKEMELFKGIQTVISKSNKTKKLDS